jgi:hypothetical protein
MPNLQLLTYISVLSSVSGNTAHYSLSQVAMGIDEHHPSPMRDVLQGESLK